MKQKNNRLNRFDEALKNRKFWVIKLSHKKKQSIILKNFTILEKKLRIFLRDYAKMMLDAGYKAKQDGTKQKERTESSKA